MCRPASLVSRATCNSSGQAVATEEIWDVAVTTSTDIPRTHVELPPGLWDCMVAVTAAVTGRMPTSAVAALSGLSWHTGSCEEAFQAIVCAIKVLQPTWGAGLRIVDEMLQYPFPKARRLDCCYLRLQTCSMGAVYLGSAVGAALGAGDVGRPSMSDLLAFASHPAGGVVMLELVADALEKLCPRAVEERQRMTTSPASRLGIICGVQASGNALVMIPPSRASSSIVAEQVSPVACRPAELEGLRTMLGAAMCIMLPETARRAPPSSGIGAPPRQSRVPNGWAYHHAG
eukprot:TRINITY_DN15586_c0_g1_i2.p1 TRINITY_DN15586_c0_g1~~TRINITY_DN15586_c0_g1_i2.p1  ORF type:complete len:288 (-),score=36.37 TRINITY_DN15586_c0_g1_i2:64-927(-)